MIIHCTSSSFNPNTVIGTTWERITGKFLLGATDGGNTGTNVLKTASAALGASGGEAAHTLANTEIPEHSHYLQVQGVANWVNYDNAWKQNGAATGAVTFGAKGSGYHYRATALVTSGEQSHNNMPPFVAVYIWKRTSLN